jgi:hypothetical protein
LGAAYPFRTVTPTFSLEPFRTRKQIIRTRLQLRRFGSDYSGLVPVAGLEPARRKHQRILSPPCLPFHHTGKKLVYFIIVQLNCQHFGAQFRCRRAAEIITEEAGH